MKGSYILLIKLDRPVSIKVGSMGTVTFNQGFYAYVGSALSNMEKRIQRHFSSKKKLFWHIDYLLEKAKIVEVFHVEINHRVECALADRLSTHLISVPKFGCSDCRCKSHLFYHQDMESIKKSVQSAFLYSVE